MTWQTWSVLPVWVLSLCAAVAIVLLAQAEDRITWLSLALAGAVILTFAIQLATQRSDGFVNRAMASIGISVLILAAATGAGVLLG